MNILAVETSTRHYSLAVFSNGKIAAKRNLELKKLLSDSMIPAIDSTLKKAGITLAGLDGFAVGLGPGSFTSLRVGLSTVKALCFALNKPVVGIGSLDVLAMNAFKKEAADICVICDAKRNLVYAALYTQNGNGVKLQTKYLLCSIDEILKKIKKPTLFVGDGIKLFKEQVTSHMKGIAGGAQFLDEKDWYPRAEKLALLAVKRFEQKKFDNADTLIPLYLYPDDCQIDKK